MNWFEPTNIRWILEKVNEVRYRFGRATPGLADCTSADKTLDYWLGSPSEVCSQRQCGLDLWRSDDGLLVVTAKCGA